MNLVPFTFNGGTINNGTTMIASMQTEGQLAPSVDIIETTRTNAFPLYAGKEFNSKILPIFVNMPSGAGTLINSLNQILDPTDTSERVFVCKDTLNSNKEWYVNAVVKQHADYGPNHAEYVLYTADPIWKAVTGGSVSYSGTSSPGTVLGTVSGNRITKPIITITPGAAKSGSYAYKRFIDVVNPNTSAFSSYPVNVVDDGSGTAVWDSGTLIAGGTIISAVGNDVRVISDGTELGRWFGNINSGTTKVWANIDLKPKQDLTLKAALGTTTPTEIEFQHYKSNLKALKSIPASGILKTPTGEHIAYTDIEVNSYKISGITRGIHNTTPGTIALGGTVTWLEHESWLVYGNASAIAPDQDDDLEPAINLVTSNNIYHDWDVFGEFDGQRTLSWKPSVVSSRGKESLTYGGNEGTTDADPFTDMGMNANGYLVGSRWQSESCDLRWDLYHPAGGTNVIYGGEVYKATTPYPLYRRLRKSINGKDYINVYNVTAPTAAGTWESFAGTTSLTGAKKYLRWQLYGGMNAVASASAFLEIDDFSMNLDSTSTPLVTLGAEQPNYNLDMTITNATTGEAIVLNYIMAVGHSLTIDCVNKTVKYDNDLSALSALTANTNRSDWMTMLSGTNTITIEEDGMTNMAINITWEETSL